MIAIVYSNKNIEQTLGTRAPPQSNRLPNQLEFGYRIFSYSNNIC